MTARPLDPATLEIVRAYLGLLDDRDAVSPKLARALLATIDDTAAREDAAWALLMTDLTSTTTDQGHH